MVKQILIQNHNRYVATECETNNNKNELPFKQNWFFEVENKRIEKNSKTKYNQIVYLKVRQ